MIRQTIEIHGKRFVMLEEKELVRLERRASRAEFRLPPLPAADAKGNRPALDYIRASIARDIIRERRALGLTQQQLAELAGVRQETLSRLESGKHSPTVRTVEKIDRAMKQFAGSKQPRTVKAQKR
jgi:DNA-binding XRE family transcriptional regulator